MRILFHVVALAVHADWQVALQHDASIVQIINGFGELFVAVLLQKLVKSGFLSAFLCVNLFQVIHLGFENLRIIDEFFGVELFFYFLKTFLLVFVVQSSDFLNVEINRV